MAQAMQNMNAKCFCGHRLSQHTSAANGCSCGVCSCKGFTEKLEYKCEVCDELISILTAPNDKIVRLRYQDDGKNYAHATCMSKRKTSGVMKKNDNQNWAKGSFVRPLTFSQKEAGRFLQILARFGVVDEESNIDHSLLEEGEDVVLVKKVLDYLEN